LAFIEAEAAADAEATVRDDDAAEDAAAADAGAIVRDDEAVEDAEAAAASNVEAAADIVSKKIGYR
jgi:hypothetical protein